MLDNFWLRMAALYGHAWVSQYGPSPDGVGADTWAGVLAGMTPSQIATGMRGATELGRDWPPSAPRFRALCFAIPSLPDMRHEFRDSRADRSAFARLLCTYLDHFRFRNSDAAKADKLLQDAYELAVAHVMAGGDLPPEPAGLIAAPQPEPRTPASEETVARAMTEAHRAIYGDRSSTEEVES